MHAGDLRQVGNVERVFMEGDVGDGRIERARDFGKGSVSVDPQNSRFCAGNSARLADVTLPLFAKGDAGGEIEALREGNDLVAAGQIGVPQLLALTPAV